MAHITSLMHTMIYPASFIYWAMNESDIEQPDFDAWGLGMDLLVLVFVIGCVVSFHGLISHKF
jgi:hypothetical protein